MWLLNAFNHWKYAYFVQGSTLDTGKQSLQSPSEPLPNSEDMEQTKQWCVIFSY